VFVVDTISRFHVLTAAEVQRLFTAHCYAKLTDGITSGTFYPLTLTFALRNIPLRYLPFTIAFYATFVDGAVNITAEFQNIQCHERWDSSLPTVSGFCARLLPCTTSIQSTQRS
jgi:hypothetical protein